MSERKVFVTGATGLVGSHVLVELSKVDHVEIFAAKRKTSNLETVAQLFKHYKCEVAFDKINWVDFDLEDVSSMPEINEVIHTAAVVSFNPADYDDMTRTNIEATQKLLKIAKESGVKKFGFVSSIASLGRTKESNQYNEQSPWSDSSANSFYSKTKYQSEKMVIDANSSEMPTFIINPGVILGPCDWNKSSGTIFKTAIKGMRFYTKGVNGFVDVRDVAKGMLNVMAKGIPSEKHIVVGENISYKEVFTKIAKNSTGKTPTIYAPKWMTEIGWRLAKLKAKIKKESPVLTKESARTAHGLNYYDNSKLPSLGDFEYHKIDDTIVNAIEFLKTNKYF
jgi:nucleoside-diphosphate-sugar epimerase